MAKVDERIRFYLEPPEAFSGLSYRRPHDMKPRPSARTTQTELLGSIRVGPWEESSRVRREIRSDCSTSDLRERHNRPRRAREEGAGLRASIESRRRGPATPVSPK